MIAAIFVDHLGRRNMLLLGLVGIIISLAVIVYSFSGIINPQMQAWVALIGCIAFVACQGLSVGPACFLIPAEIYPAKIRGVGMGVSITFNWLTNFLVALFFPIIVEGYGVAFAFKIFIALSVVGFIIFYLYVPETRQVSLEQIEFNILNRKRLRLLGNKTAIE